MKIACKRAGIQERVAQLLPRTTPEVAGRSGRAMAWHELMSRDGGPGAGDPTSEDVGRSAAVADHLPPRDVGDMDHLRRQPKHQLTNVCFIGCASARSAPRRGLRRPTTCL